MSKFHITSSGQPAACQATVRECPLGGEHFDSIEEAAVASVEAEVGATEQTLEDEQSMSDDSVEKAVIARMTFPAAIEGEDPFVNIMREAEFYDRIHELSDYDLMELDEFASKKEHETREGWAANDEMMRRLDEGTIEERVEFRNFLEDWTSSSVGRLAWIDVFPDSYRALEEEHIEQEKELLSSLSDKDILERRNDRSTPYYLLDLYGDELDARGYWD